MPPSLDRRPSCFLHAGQGEGFEPLGAGSAPTARGVLALVAGPGILERHTQANALPNDTGLVQAEEGGVETDRLAEGEGFRSLERLQELLPAVGVDRPVAGMGGKGDKIAPLCRRNTEPYRQ